jgi:molybdopterin molybdotransferase
VVGSVRRVSSERIVYTEAVDRILAETIVSGEDIPSFHNSSMDGFAVRSADVAESGNVLEILEDLAAGQVASVEVGPGQAIRIMTGAPMPDGADAVVRVEDTFADDGTVTIGTTVRPGNFVRPAGGDVPLGATVINAGVRLTPVHVGVLATLGTVKLVVARRPRVGVLSTGDELAPPETVELGPGMIRDSNRPMLVSLVEGAGGEVVDYEWVPDDADLLRATLGRAAAETDMIVTSGGVSMGDYDVTKIVLRDEATIDFMQVAMKPGKPLGFGHLGGIPFFGLPGNPVSALVSFENFVRPALLTMQGARAVLRPRIKGVAGEPLDSDPAKTTFVRVSVDGDWVARSTGGQDSNVLSAAGDADAFAVIPRGVATIDKGEPALLELLHCPATREFSNDE